MTRRRANRLEVGDVVIRERSIAANIAKQNPELARVTMEAHFARSVSDHFRRA